MRKFLASKLVLILNHFLYSSDLALCDYFLFPKIKNSEVRKAVEHYFEPGADPESYHREGHWCVARKIFFRRLNIKYLNYYWHI